MTSNELQKLADTLYALSEKAKAKIYLCEERTYKLSLEKRDDESEELRESRKCGDYFDYLRDELKSASEKITDAVESLKLLESKGETL